MFTAEKDLIQAFMNVAANFLRSNVGKSISPYFLVEEFDSHLGVVDIVMGTYSRIEEQELSRKSISWNWARPFSNFTEDQEFEMNGFMKTFGISKTTARARLKEYSEAGFIKKVSNGQYRVVEEYSIVTEKVISSKQSSEIGSEHFNKRQDIKDSQIIPMFSLTRNILDQL